MFRKMRRDHSAWIYRFSVVVSFILFAAVVRVLPHPWNFTPVGAMALFSGAKLGRSWKAFVFPLAALFCGDVFGGLYSVKIMSVVYFSFCLSVLIGISFRRKQTPLPLSFATLLAAVQFYLITNFAIWAFATTYAHDLRGLAACYITGTPYFVNTLAGDAFYATLFFGGFAFLERFSSLSHARERQTQ